jgi:hypothetical protein
MSVVEKPRNNDVLFGRDSGSWSHEGNKFFRVVVRKYQVEYHSKRNRLDRVAIVAKIVQEMKNTGARFLKKDPSTKKWYEVTRKSVIEKVSRLIVY